MNAVDNKPWVGRPLDRVDGPLKVAGEATYAADYRSGNKALIGVIVEAEIAAGELTSLDVTAAEASAGVKLVMTHENAPAQKPFGKGFMAARFSQSHAMLEDKEIRHSGFPIAFVVADTLEQARHAANLIRAEYRQVSPTLNAKAHKNEAQAPASLDGGGKADSEHGDFDKEWKKAAHRVDAQYETPNQHAAAMEPHATVATWTEDGKLHLYMALQIISSGVAAIANTLKMSQSDIHIQSPYIGGGFGSKLGIHNEAVLAALAAKTLKTTVRIAQHRRALFNNGPHRSRTWQTVRLAADENGKLVAVEHTSLAQQARDYPFCEPTAAPTRGSYATRALRTKHRIVVCDIPKVDSMRAPGEAIGTLTIETAMDELAAKCGIDPVEFRIRNEPLEDPDTKKPFATRPLIQCLEQAAGKFGWQGSQLKPGSRREGNWLIGHGMAVAIRANLLQQGEAEAGIDRDGKVTLKLDMTDIGTGTYTILAQIAADGMGTTPDRVEVRLADSHFPVTAGSGGSFGAATSGGAVHDACGKLRDELIRRAGKLDSEWRGVNSADLNLSAGEIRVGGRAMPVGALIEESDKGAITVKGSIKPGREHQDYAQYSYGAQFAEVAVDAYTGEVRLRRLVGVFDGGRILNEKTARSQLMGGMIFGIGGALYEESLMDDRFGAFMNRDLAEYHIAVNRDIPKLEIDWVTNVDFKSNPLGSKGLGELGICGAGPAVANAIHDATGFRARKFPIHVEDILPHLPALA